MNNNYIYIIIIFLIILCLLYIYSYNEPFAQNIDIYNETKEIKDISIEKGKIDIKDQIDSSIKNIKNIKNYIDTENKSGKLTINKLDKPIVIKNVIMCGLVRNAITNIENNLKSLIKIGNNYEKYKIILVENDSIDGTDLICKKYAQDYSDNIILISGNLNENMIFKNKDLTSNVSGPFSNKRFQKMAFLRNLYINEMNNISWFPSDDCVVIIVDLDLYDLNPELIINTINKYSDYDWNVLCANGVERNLCLYEDIKLWNIPVSNLCTVELDNNVKSHYYDSLATRFIGDSNDTMAEISEYDKYDIDFLEARKKHELKAWTFIKSTTEEPIKVKSCFGGLAIYKSKLLFNNYYSAGDCEHISLHNSIKDNIYILPEMVIYYD